MWITRTLGLCLVLMMFVLSGCSTTQTRAREHAELFLTLPIEVKERLEAGKPAVGDTKEMVYIALGEPDAITTRVDETGIVSDIWSYDGVYYTRDTFWPYPSMFRSHGRYGYDYFYSGPEYIQIPHEYERLRIEFSQGKVKAIEQRQR